MRLLPVAALALALLPAAGARAATTSITGTDAKRLWATINVCDTADFADTVGIRASMPGLGNSRERLYMRFRVQYLRPSDGRWRDIGPGGDSGFVLVGSGRWRRREAGQNFTLNPPAAGRAFRVRGLVTFEWRRGQLVVRREQQRTHGGHRGTTGADPEGYSAASCVVTG